MKKFSLICSSGLTEHLKVKKCLEILDDSEYDEFAAGPAAFTLVLNSARHMSTTLLDSVSLELFFLHLLSE